MAQTSSVCLMMLISAFRLVGIKYPFLAQRFCTPTLVKWTISIVIFGSIGFNIVRFFELDLKACFSLRFDQPIQVVTTTDLRHDEVGSLLLLNMEKCWFNYVILQHFQLYYMSYSVIAYTLVNFGLPFSFLIVTNFLIFTTVRHSLALRQLMAPQQQSTSTTAKPKHPSPTSQNIKASTSRDPSRCNSSNSGPKCSTGGGGNNQTDSSHVAKETKTTIMLIVVVLVFLASNSLAFVCNIIEVLIRKMNLHQMYDTYLDLVEISNLLIVLNSAINIFIYWSFSKKYRAVFYFYVPWCRKISRRSRRHRNGAGGFMTPTTTVAPQATLAPTVKYSPVECRVIENQQRKKPAAVTTIYRQPSMTKRRSISSHRQQTQLSLSSTTAFL